MLLVTSDEAQPLSRSIRAVRMFYYASMAVGYPLWLLVTLVLVARTWLTLWPLPDTGPVELQSPSAVQTGVLGLAGFVFFIVYQAVFFWAHRITHHPWVVFAAMLMPVLTLFYGVSNSSITDSDSEELTWLTYLGSLALVLAAGTIVASVSQRLQPGPDEAPE
jgi:hypothetical protein